MSPCAGASLLLLCLEAFTKFKTTNVCACGRTFFRACELDKKLSMN